MSSPFSMIVVARRTSNSPPRKLNIVRSSTASLICPWAIARRASGTRRLRRLALDPMDSTRLWTTYTCPPRFSSLRTAVVPFRAGNRRGGQRQDVDRSLDRLDRLLVGDPESLLLVDHQEQRFGVA